MAVLKEIQCSLLLHSGIVQLDGSVWRQDYSPQVRPEGVEVIKLPVFNDEYGGHFLENARFEDGQIKALKEKGVDLNIINGQSNTSVIQPGTERFGHVHRDQDELWIVVDGTLTVALYDIRSETTTRGTKTKLILSKGMGVRIPPGVVHGLGNYTNEKAVLTYYANKQFTADENTREWRFVPDHSDFWDFAKPDKI